MKHITKLLFILLFISLCSSCRWVSTSDIMSMQNELNDKFYGYKTTTILNTFGQPTTIERDTIDNIVVTKMHFEDMMVFSKKFGNINTELQTGTPYIEFYAKEGQIFSTKTNLSKKVISRNEKTISIIKIATYSGVLLFIIFLVALSLILTRKSKFEKYDREIESLQIKLNEPWEEIKRLSYRLKDVETELNNSNMQKILNEKIRNIGFSVKTFNCLKAAEIETIAKLCTCKKKEIKNIRNLGKKSIKEIEEILGKLNLHWEMNLSDFGYDKKGNKIEK